MGPSCNSLQQADEEDEICYHHYSFTFDTSQLNKRFNGVRIILIGGCPHRAARQARYLEASLSKGGPVSVGSYPCELLTKPTSRFVLYQVGPVLVGNHGMGAPSMSIAIHELLLMCRRAGVLEQIYLIRFGTCGGIGVKPGTICITNRAMDPLFSEEIELKICNKLVKRPCVVDQKTASYLELLARLELEQRDSTMEELGEFDVRIGATVATNDFYEEQGRTNGIICDHTRQDTMQFLQRAHSLGVINIEMESNFLAAMCHKLGVRFGIVCVSLADRLSTDKVHLSAEQASCFEKRLFWLISRFVYEQILGSGNALRMSNPSHSN